MLLTRKLSGVALMIACLVTAPFSAAADLRSQTPGVTDKEILVSSLSMTSGPGSDYGRLSNVGVDALLNSVNDNGGVFGRKIRCLHPDDKYNKETAINNFNRVVEQGVFGFISVTGTAEVVAYLPGIERLGIPAVGGFSAPEFTGEPPKHFYYQTRMSFVEETERIVDKLWAEGFRRIGVVYPLDAYGRDIIEGSHKGLRKHGSDVALDSAYAWGHYKGAKREVNFEETVKQLKSANPPLDAVIMAAIYGPAGQIMKLARENQVTPVFAFVNSSFCPGVHDVLAEGEPISLTVPLYVSPELPAVANFKKDMAKYFPNEKVSAWSFKGYIDAMVFVEALRRAGKDLTREKFVAALEKMKNVDLGLGKDCQLSYTRKDHWGFHKQFWVTLKNGSVVPFDWSSVHHTGTGK